MKKYQILCIDGGGLKGVFPAGILAEWEKTFSTRIIDHFDLISGTSTGGIISLALGKGMSPAAVLDFYLDWGPEIFSGADTFLAKMLHNTQSKYDSVPLAKELKKCFGGTLLGESQKRLVIPAYDLENDDIRLLKTSHAPRLRNDYKLPMWQVALATSSAPTYFSACTAISNTRLVDGGMWANNPTMVALTEALSMGIPPESIRILSLGTSWSLINRDEKMDTAGRFGWREEAINVMFRGQSHAAVKQAELILRPFGENRVSRVDFPVPAGTYELDSVDAKKMLRKVEYLARHDGERVFQRHFLSHLAAPFEPEHKLQQQELENSYVS